MYTKIHVSRFKISFKYKLNDAIWIQISLSSLQSDFDDRRIKGELIILYSLSRSAWIIAILIMLYNENGCFWKHVIFPCAFIPFSLQLVIVTFVCQWWAPSLFESLINSLSNDSSSLMYFKCVSDRSAVNALSVFFKAFHTRFVPVESCTVSVELNSSLMCVTSRPRADPLSFFAVRVGESLKKTLPHHFCSFQWMSNDFCPQL